MLKNGQANKEKNIRAGFAVCGIYPLNIQRVLSRLPPERTAVQNEMSAQLTEELKKSRYGDPEKATRAKKANRLPPGVSYTVSAIPKGEPVAVKDEEGAVVAVAGEEDAGEVMAMVGSVFKHSSSL
jgi:hypothetical protein